jgi:hypothetical protein
VVPQGGQKLIPKKVLFLRGSFLGETGEEEAEVEAAADDEWPATVAAEGLPRPASIANNKRGWGKGR